MLDLNGSQRTWVIGLLCAANVAYLATSWRGEIRMWMPWDIVRFELPKVICFSPAEMATPIVQFFGSVAVIVAISAACQQARKTVDKHVRDGLVRNLFFEVIAAADMCGSCFELTIVANNFGIWAYGLLFFLLTIWWGRVWGDATACPYTHLEDVILGKVDTQMALMKTWAELTGGILVFRLTQMIWGLELIETHTGRSIQQCEADLQVMTKHYGFQVNMLGIAVVTMLVGAVIEGIATCLCQLLGKALSDIEPKHADIINSFVGTSLVVAAFNYTGGYFNPVLATALQFGCKGHTITEHLVVYWGGACIGSALSVFLYHHTQLKSVVRKLAKFKTFEDEDYEKEE